MQLRAKKVKKKEKIEGQRQKVNKTLLLMKNVY